MKIKAVYEEIKYKWVIIPLLVIITLLFLFIVFDWTMSALMHMRKEVMVPSITGKSLTDALEIVSRYNLGLKKESQEYHPDLPIGTVTRQFPPPGMTVREGKIIKVTISQGSETLFVPDLIGQPLRQAELIAHKNLLKIGEKKEIYSLLYQKDEVISQNPPPNSIVNKYTPINLIVSLGPPPEGIIIMPNFAGNNIIDAKKWCEAKNLNFNIIENKQPGIPGTIIQQFPSPDEVVFSTETVKFVVISGEVSSERIEGTTSIHYEVPQSAREQKVKIVMIDETGEKEIYSNIHQPGSKIDLFISKKGKAKVRFFLNNILVEERIY